MRPAPRLAVALALALDACGTAITQERRYSGDLLPESPCGAPLHGTMTTYAGKFALAPSDGALLIRGDVGADGKASGELATTGVDHKPFVMRFAGTVSPGKVEGRYVTPRCSYAVSLAFVAPSIF
ncbi:MAG TPA: hypothetical protein VHS58_18510 [Acetobacteraceae bacterium]|jgi:hypothetical protein|nr:hypothetical protein [Acetobacteraceae bacterium]